MPRKKNLNPNQKIDGFMGELFALGAEQKFAESYYASIGWEPVQHQADDA